MATPMRLVKTPPERIVAREHLIAAFNAEKMIRAGKFVVSLACGHLCYTRNQNTAVCPRCSEMLRRSIKDGKEDCMPTGFAPTPPTSRRA